MKTGTARELRLVADILRRVETRDRPFVDLRLHDIARELEQIADATPEDGAPILDADIARICDRAVDLASEPAPRVARDNAASATRA